QSVRDWCDELPAERRLQSDRHYRSADLLVARRDPQAIPEKPGPAGARVSWISAVRPSRRPLCGLLRMTSFLMPSVKPVMLRSARRARLEARTTAMRVLLACALLLVGNAVARAQYPDKQAFEVIEHGRYMASAADGTACHPAR